MILPSFDTYPICTLVLQLALGVLGAGAGAKLALWSFLVQFNKLKTGPKRFGIFLAFEQGTSKAQVKEIGNLLDSFFEQYGFAVTRVTHDNEGEPSGIEVGLPKREPQSESI